MEWLLTFLINIGATHSTYSLNRWACETVNTYAGADPSGCYDWCNAHSMYQITDGNIHDVGGKITYHNDNKFYRRASTGLSDDFPHHIQNACAVVMIGGEW